MSTWAEKRDAWIEAKNFLELPNDMDVFRMMLEEGALDGAVDWSLVVIPE